MGNGRGCGGKPLQNGQKGAALWAVSWGGEGRGGCAASHWNTWLGAAEEKGNSSMKVRTWAGGGGSPAAQSPASP